jgi:feruloyl esterase
LISSRDADTDPKETQMDPLRLPLPAAAQAASLLALAGCGGSDVTPQIAPATPAALSGRCEDLANRLGTLAGTRITSTGRVEAGTLKVAGKDIPAHCLVSISRGQKYFSVDDAASFDCR